MSPFLRYLKKKVRAVRAILGEYYMHARARFRADFFKTPGGGTAERAPRPP